MPLLTQDSVDLARSRAKADGSPSVLEIHLLTALLEIQSKEMDNALTGLGTNRTEMRETLHEIQRRTDIEEPPYSFFSEFPSQV